MKHYSKLFKRAQAWVLTIAMLLPLVNSGLLLGISAADETLPVRDKVVTTEGKIVADNYELSEAEEALLASGLLVGKTISIEKPNDTDKLISVDSDAHAIKAVEWTDENGYVWKPVVARIMVGEAKEETVKLTNGEGTYEYGGNAFSVHVDYEVRADVSADKQNSLLNAGAALRNDMDACVGSMEAINSTASGILEILASDLPVLEGLSPMEVLVRMASEEGLEITSIEIWGAHPTIKFAATNGASQEERDAAIAAVGELDRQKTANNGKFDLSVALSAYDDANKVKYFVSGQQEAVKSTLKETRDQIESIYKVLAHISDFWSQNTEAEGAAELVDNLVTLTDKLGSWVTKVDVLMAEAKWNATMANPFHENLTEQEWAEAEDLVEALENPLDKLTAAISKVLFGANVSYDTLEEAVAFANSSLKKENFPTTWDDSGIEEALAYAKVREATQTDLVAATTTLRHNMSMFDVTVTVSLNLTTGNGESYAPYDKIVKTATVTLAENAPKDEILAAIATTGVEVAAINAWIDAGVYVAGQFNTAGAVGVPETLTKDTHVSITYSPNKYTVELQYEDTTKELYYGAKVYLPVHGDSAKSYDYDVNNAKHYYQGEWVTVTENITITRTEGKAYVGTPLNQLVGSVIFAGNKNAASIMTSGALTIGNQELLIRYPDASCVVYDKNDRTLTATEFSSGYQNRNWVPATYTIFNNGDDPITKNYEGHIDLSAIEYDRVTVSFKLDLPETGVLDLITLPYDLWGQAKNQKTALDRLLALNAPDEDGERDLAMLNESMLKILTGDASPFAGYPQGSEEEAIRQVFAAMLVDDECMDSSTGNLKLYDQLIACEQYASGSLVYYYENSKVFKSAVNALNKHLSELLKTDERVEILAQTMKGFGVGSFAEYLPNLQGKVAEYNAMLEPVDSRVDTTKDLDVLLNALSAKTNPFTAYTEVPDFFLTRDFSVDAPDKATIKVTLTGGDKVDVEISKTFNIGYVLTAENIEEIKALVKKAIFDRGVDEFFYAGNEAEIEWPAAGTVMAAGGINLTATWTPKTFNVVVNGQTQTITFADRVVELPASTDSNIRFDYYLNGAKLNVVDGKYTFTGVEDAFKTLFKTGTCEIILDPVDIADEQAAALRAELVAFVDGLNSSIGNGAMSFVLVENGGKYSVVMKIDGSQANALAGAVEGLAMGFVTSGYSTIAMDNKGVFADSQISLQALIDAIMNSGFSTNDLQYAIDADGNVKNLELPGTVVTGDKTLGGKLITTTMQISKGDTTREMDLYITLGSASSEIVQIRNLFAGNLNGYFSVEFAGGKSIVNLQVPEKAYEAYLAGLLVTGYLDIRDINEMELQIAGKFLFDIVHPLFDAGSDMDTLRNTLELFGFAPDLSAGELETLFNLVRDRHQSAYQSIVFDEITGTITKTISIQGLLGTLNVPENLTGFIKEYDTGITISSAARIPQTGYDYEAAYVDVRAENKLDMIGLIKKGQLASKKLSGASIVVLLANVDGDLTFDKTTVLNLNGFTVNGNVKATGNLTIVDSCLEQNGSVTGTVSGNVTVLSGRYTSELSDTMLKAGYEQYKDEDGNYVVHNKFYNFVKDNEGNITIQINAGLLNPSHYDGEIPDVKFMVLDLAVDMFFNGYTTNYLEIDGNLVYHLGVDDFVGLYTGEDRKQELIDAVRKMFDAQAIVNIMNLIIDDVTDFDALYEALANDQPLFSYDMTTGSWKIITDRVEAGDKSYFTIGIGSGDTELGEYKTRKLHIEIVGSDEDKQHLLDILEQFRDTTDVKIDLAPVQGSYDSQEQNIVLGWGGYGTITVDFTENENYAVMFGILLADGLKGTATSEKLVAAIREYYETDNMYALKTAFNAVTVSQLMDTFMDYNRKSDIAKMINELGLNGVVDEKVNELEDLYARYAKVLTAVARRIDNRFDLPESGRTLGSFYNSTLKGYGFIKENIDKNVIRNDILRGFGVDLTAKVECVSIVIRIFNDDQPPVDEEINYSALENAIAEAQKYLDKEDQYTPESWAVFKDAYKAALEARNSLDQDDVNAKAAALYRAIDGLTEKEPPVEIDYTDLDNAIEAAEKYLDREDDFLAEAWEKFMTAYNYAVEVRQNSVDQGEVNKAASNLWSAIAYLVEHPAPEEEELDYSALEAEIKKAEGKVESDFTADSWAAMQAVLTEAKAMFENKTAETQEEIDAMVSRLHDAINQLQPANPDDPENPVDPEDGKVDFDKDTHTNVANFYKKGNVYVADAHHATGMTVGAFLEILSGEFPGLTVKAFEADGTTEITDMDRLFFTGAVIKVLNGSEVVFTYTAAVLGDLDGDGRSTAKDSFLMKLHAAEGTELDDHFFAAIDQNDDGVYNAKDSFLTAYKAANWETYRTTATAES